MSHGKEAGFTIVEVLVAAVLVAVGVLGAAQLVSVATGQSSRTNGRNGATNIARRVVEVARGTPARTLDSATIMATLQAAATDIPDISSADSVWTTRRQGFTYTITPSVCTRDDPGDGVGTHDGSYCANPAATTPPDGQPADFKQVSVTVSWTPNGNTDPIKGVTNVPIGAGGDLPMVSSISMSSPFSCTSTCPAISSMGTSSARFSVTTTNSPATFTWLVDGGVRGSCPPVTTTCSGSGNAFSFVWNMGSVTKDSSGMCIAGAYSYDGVYQIGARGQDVNGLSGGPSSLSVNLNRCAPIPPPNFAATQRDASTTVIDMDWEDNPEGDILGYRVYKGTSNTSRTPICPPSISAGQVIAPDAPRECTDPSPPNYSKNSAYYYGVYAVDRDAGGALREGALAYINVNQANKAPNAPTNFAVIAAPSGPTLSWTLPNTLDPDNGDTIDSFRIYRRVGSANGGTTPVYTERIDRDSLKALCVGTSCSYVDTTANGTTHTYWITAVDTRMRESSFVGPKTG